MLDLKIYLDPIIKKIKIQETANSFKNINIKKFLQPNKKNQNKFRRNKKKKKKRKRKEKRKIKEKRNRN